MTDLSQLKFYATHPHPCSYLPREQATTLFLDPQQPLDVETYSELSEMGFRRSGDHLYRPHCRACNACIPARIPVAEFEPNSQQKRILKKNRDLHVTEASPEPSDEIYDLYQRYICARHADGVNGISAVYTFFDPQEHKRSLGRFAILWQIQHTRDLEMDSVYLGYWIKDCRKMNYKTEYRPIEMLVNQRWVRLT